MGVAESDCGISPHKFIEKRKTNEVTSADYHDFHAIKLNPIVIDNLENSCRSAGYDGWLFTTNEFKLDSRSETVHILRGINLLYEAVRVNALLFNRQLHDNSIDLSSFI